MPLVVFCGPPCSGKTTRANQLAEHLRGAGKTVTVVNNESLGVVRSEAYESAASEKISRANMKAAVEREISTERVLICDDLNYIKGYRYELFCIARAQGTSVCTVHCTAPPEQAAANNHPQPGGYTASQLQELPLRFEK